MKNLLLGTCLVLGLAIGLPLPAAHAGEITGRLVLNDSGNGNVLITLREAVATEFVTYHSTLSGPDGSFYFSSEFLPPGTYLSGVLQDDDFPQSFLVPHLSDISLSISSNTNLGDLPLLPANRWIRGQVLTGFSSGSTELICTATINGTSYLLWAYADSENRFNLKLADGEWTITAEQYSGGPVSQTKVTVDGRDEENVEILLGYQLNFSAWAAYYGLQEGQDLPFVDPDEDGFDNAQEFAFGTDPLSATSALVQSTRTGNQFTLSWLERTDASVSYSVRESSDLGRWQTAAITAQDVSNAPAPPQGYARKQFSVPASGRKFYRVLSTDNPAALPVESFTINVAGEPVTVERWGTGPKAVIMFGYVPFTMQDDLKAIYAREFAGLVGSDYSMFLWTYPEAGPFAQADLQIDDFFFDPELALQNRRDFTGHTSSIVAQIRAATGLTEVCVVGNSFGAGVVLWDFATLSADPNVRFVLISPTEVFMPYPNLLPTADPLPRTVLLADAPEDPFFNPANDDVRNYVSDRSNITPLPGRGHFIIGEVPTSLDYVFSLIDLVYSQP